MKPPLFPRAALAPLVLCAVTLAFHLSTTHRLPQFFADMHGWPELPETVAGVFHDSAWPAYVGPRALAAASEVHLIQTRHGHRMKALNLRPFATSRRAPR
jgi:hypothetical protein